MLIGLLLVLVVVLVIEKIELAKTVTKQIEDENENDIPVR